MPEEGGIYLIATRSLCAGDYFEVMRDLVRAGVGMVQMREKIGTASERLALAGELREITAEAGIPLVVNDEPLIARDVDADGVHIGQHDLTVAEARAVVGADRWVGLSTHGVAQIRAAEGQDIDMIGVGPIFETSTKVNAGAPTGVELLDDAANFAPGLPAFAIGGINAGNVQRIVDRGHRRIAVSSAILAASDPLEALAGLCAALA